MVKLLKAALLIAALVWGQWAFGGETVMLDFASPTCGPCHQMKPTVHSLKQAGYPIREVDVTQEPGLASRFGIDRVPCFVMLQDGQEVDRVLGATSRQRLEGMFRRVRDREAKLQEKRIRTQSPDPPAQGVFWTGVGSAEAPQRNDAPPADPSVVPVAAVSEAVAAENVKPGDLLSASVRIRVDESDGHSYGTGTIIDAREGEALIITCGHLFRESNGNNPVMVELLEQGPDGPRVFDQLTGQVIEYDLDRDLGLVSIKPERPVHVAAVAPPRTAIQRGDRVQTVGCDNGKDLTVLPTRVTAIDRYQGPPNIEVDGAPVEGRSGGGLFNAAGQLIGVCFAADYEGNEGLFAGLESIHDQLAGVGLSEIYESADAGAPVMSQGPAAAGPVVRGQEPLQPLMAVPDGTVPVAAVVSADQAPATAPIQQPTNLDPLEQAAWEEITGRASESEVICIIRPKDPSGKSEVITLNGVSPEFVRALAGRQQQSPDSVVR